jgi:hypothetical protein
MLSTQQISTVDSISDQEDNDKFEMEVVSSPLKSKSATTASVSAPLFMTTADPPLDNPSLQPYAVYFYCSCCFKGYHSIVYSNPWYCIHRQSCPHCGKEQIPMLDINLPINARELDPNMEFYYNEMTDEEFLPGFSEIVENCDEFSSELSEPVIKLLFAENFFEPAQAKYLQEHVSLKLLLLIVHAVRCSKQTSISSSSSLHLNPKHLTICRNAQVLLLHLMNCRKATDCLFPFCTACRPVLCYLSSFPSELVTGKGTSTSSRSFSSAPAVLSTSSSSSSSAEAVGASVLTYLKSNNCALPVQSSSLPMITSSSSFSSSPFCVNASCLRNSNKVSFCSCEQHRADASLAKDNNLRDGKVNSKVSNSRPVYHSPRSYASNSYLNHTNFYSLVTTYHSSTSSSSSMDTSPSSFARPPIIRFHHQSDRATEPTKS